VNGGASIGDGRGVGDRLQPQAVVRLQDAGEERDQGLALGRREAVEQRGLGPLRHWLQEPPEPLSGAGEHDVLAPSVRGVALSVHEAPLLEQVDVADQMAALDVQALGELVLRERSEVRQRGEDGDVGEAHVVLGQRVQQEPLADARDVAGQVIITVEVM
jgi:hypothetical protein